MMHSQTKIKLTSENLMYDLVKCRLN